jgi:hypothetical protein
VTTRRLLNIAVAYSIFGDKKKALNMSITRFPQETQDAWLSAYEKLDDGMDDTETKTTDGFVPPKGSCASPASKYTGSRITEFGEIKKSDPYIFAVDYNHRQVAKSVGAIFDGDYWTISSEKIIAEMCENGYIVTDHR